MNNIVSIKWTPETKSVEGQLPPIDQVNFMAKHTPLYIMRDSGAYEQLSKDQGQAVIRTDTGEFLGRTGGRYGIAQNPDINKTACQAIETAFTPEDRKDVELKERISDGGAFSKWTYTFPSLGAPIRQLRDATGYNAARYGQGYADTWLNFSISIVNSFNGLTPVFVTSEHQDVSCLNSLTMSFQDTTRLRHSTNIDVTKLAEWIEGEALNFKTKIAVWQSWANKSITSDQAAETLKLCGVSDRLTKQLMDQFEEEADKRGRSVWALASSLSFMSTHNSERFGVRGSAKKDNEARSLHARQNQVLKIMDQPAWAELAAA